MPESATNFSKDSISEINDILEFVLKNRHSGFYSKKYGQTDFSPIKSYEDFQKIPFLEKDEIGKAKVKDRTFIPQEEITHYAFSGGTSNGRSTIIPRSGFPFKSFQEDLLNDEMLLSLGIKKLMVLRVPNSAPMLTYLKMPHPFLKIIPGDTNNLSLTARIAKELNIESITTTPSRLQSFIKELQESHFQFERIRLIHLSAEYTSRQKLAYFRQIFPQAIFKFTYGDTMGGKHGHRCQYLDKDKAPYFYHPAQNLVIEIFNNNSPARLGESGEIVSTHLKPQAAPLIRYKTGNIAILTEEKCKCGEKYLLEFKGRKDSDIVEISGRQINIQDIEDSIDPLRHYLHPIFQLRINGKNNTKSIKLHLKLKEDFTALKYDLKFKKDCEKEIFYNLLANTRPETKTENKEMPPVEIIFDDTLKIGALKWKHIISE